MFRYLQSRIRGTATTGPGVPPPSLIAFYWHFVRQTRGWYLAVFATSLAVALIDMVIPVFIGRLVALIVHGCKLSVKDNPTPAVTFTPMAPAFGLRPFTAGAVVSWAAWWHKTMLPGVV